MSGIKDLTGQRFGSLTAKKYVGAKDGDAKWLCQCDCGNESIVYANNLKRGTTKSCGCKRYNKVTIHGKSRTRLYNIWGLIIERCTNGNNPSYKNYGGRGITMCDEWRNNFEEFRNWALANGYEENLTIDREDNDGNYEPSNCRWVTRSRQANNKRSNHLLTYDNETHTLTEWAKLTGIPRDTLKCRIYRGWEIERALNP